MKSGPEEMYTNMAIDNPASHGYAPPDRPREHCGVFGIYGHPEAARLTYFGLYALQHRGQESCGIVTGDDPLAPRSPTKLVVTNSPFSTARSRMVPVTGARMMVLARLVWA